VPRQETGGAVELARPVPAREAGGAVGGADAPQYECCAHSPFVKSLGELPQARPVFFRGLDADGAPHRTVFVEARLLKEWDKMRPGVEFRLVQFSRLHSGVRAQIQKRVRASLKKRRRDVTHELRPDVPGGLRRARRGRRGGGGRSGGSHVVGAPCTGGLLDAFQLRDIKGPTPAAPSTSMCKKPGPSRGRGERGRHQASHARRLLQCFCSDWWGSAPMAMLLPQSSQVLAPRARSGTHELLQASGQRLVRSATTMRAAAFTLFFAKCGLLSVETGRRDGTCHTTPPPQVTTRTYPSPSRRLSGSRADTSGPSSRRSCAFQSDPLNNMNRPATRRGRISVATAQMP